MVVVGEVPDVSVEVSAAVVGVVVVASTVTVAVVVSPIVDMVDVELVFVCSSGVVGTGPQATNIANA